MSLILDALNKADKERQPTAPLPYMPPDAITPQKKEQKNKWQLLTIALLLFFCLLFLVLILLRGTTETIAPTSANIDDQGTEPAPPSAIVITASQPNEATQQKSDGRANDQKVVLKKHAKSISDERVSTQQALIAKQYAARAKAPMAATKNTQVDSLYQQPEPEAPTTRNSNSNSNNVPAVVQQSSAMLGGIRSLPSSLQDELPSLTYTEHNPSKQSVRINRKTLTNGNQISADLIVDEVLADGVILRFKGYKFKLDAYSSWVNM